MRIENDLRYRGPFSYRSLRLFALLAMTASQICTILLELDRAFAIVGITGQLGTEWDYAVIRALRAMGGITFPLLLVASMSIVIRDQKKVFRVMLSNLFLAGVTYFFIVNIAEVLVKEFIRDLPKILADLDIQKFGKQFLTALVEGARKNTQTLESLTRQIGLEPEFLESFLSEHFEIPITFEDIGTILESISAADIADELMRLAESLIQSFGLDRAEVFEGIADTITTGIVRSHLNVNVFVDLFWCTVFYFFTCYSPRRLRGGKRMLFRSCAVFPASYLMLGIVMNGMNRGSMITLPLWVVGLLTSRKLPGILLFFAMILYIKYYEAEFMERDGNREAFAEYLGSNRNSFRFSLFLCVVLGLLSAGDYFLGKIPELGSWGVGSSATMYLAVPFVLLFSYNRRTRFKILDVFVPIYYTFHYLIMITFCYSLLTMIPDWITQHIP